MRSRHEAVPCPVFQDVGIVALVYHRWREPWKTPHYILTHISRYFNVVWVEPGYHWREALVRKNPRSSSVDEPAAWPELTVYEPWWLPDVYRPERLAKLSLDIRIRRATESLKRKGCRSVVLYVWHPRFQPATSKTSHELLCYHIDDDYSYFGVQGPVNELESQLIEQADLVFMTSPGLLESKGRLNRRTTMVPEGVDFGAYSSPLDQPIDMKEIPHPRIGYTGHLKKQLDWPLISRLVEKHPNWSFVFVGPENHHSEIGVYLRELRRKANVYMLGEKTIHQLAAYPQHFDVCYMPYRVDSYTNQIYPLKLHEYLAGGRPVVGSPIRSLRLFSDVIVLAETLDGWSAAIEQCLSAEANRKPAVDARRQTARQHDWQQLVQGIVREMCICLNVSHECLEEEGRNQRVGIVPPAFGNVVSDSGRD